MAERIDFANNRVVDAHCPLLPPDSARAQVIYWDATDRGFGLLVGKTARTWIVQKDVNRRTVRTKLGRYPAVSASAARKAAKKTLAAMELGTDPNEEKRAKVEARRKSEWERFTLREAMEAHIQRMETKQRAERSMTQMREEMERHLSDWLDRPLVDIRRADCQDRHRRMTEKRGPVVANRVMVLLRASWNTARRRFEDLPPHPVIGVDFNPQDRRREPVPWEHLPLWAQRVNGLRNPVRRDLAWVILLTGLRSLDARTIREEHIDFKKGLLHRPNPKGGAKAAFTIPVSAVVLAILRRRIRENPKFLGGSARGWVFPTRNNAGEVTYTREGKEQRYVKGEDGKPLLGPDGKLQKVTYLPSPHRLRDTFATACLEARIGTFETKVLLNHRLPQKDITEGYQRPSDDFLREAAEKVAALLLERAKEGPVGVPLPEKKAGPPAEGGAAKQAA